MKIKDIIVNFLRIGNETNQMNEVKVYFDFPLQGRNDMFKVKSITKDGNIVLYNPFCERPLGHEIPK